MFLFFIAQPLTAQVEVEGWEVRMNKRQPPVTIMDAIGIKPGMTVGEVGAGTGRLTLWIAERVGSEGLVLANDINKKSLEHLKERCKKGTIKNVRTIVGTVNDPFFPAGKLDVAFMINVYHHLDDPMPVVRNIIPALKKGGILAIVDADPVKSGFGDDHSTPKAEMLEQLDAAGYTVLKVLDVLHEDYIYIAEPKTK